MANFSLFKLTLYKKWENIAKRLKVDRKPLACEDVFKRRLQLLEMFEENDVTFIIHKWLTYKIMIDI